VGEIRVDTMSDGGLPSAKLTLTSVLVALHVFRAQAGEDSMVIATRVPNRHYQELE
jgi:hypothetical protein